MFVCDLPRESQWSCIFLLTTVTVSDSFGRAFTERQEVCWCDRVRQGTRDNRLQLPPCQQEAGSHAGSKGETAAHCCSVAVECELLRVLKNQVFYQSLWSASLRLSSRKAQGALVLLLNCVCQVWKPMLVCIAARDSWVLGFKNMEKESFCTVEFWHSFHSVMNHLLQQV